MKLKELEAVCPYIDKISILNKKINAILPLSRYNLYRDLENYGNCKVINIAPRFDTSDANPVNLIIHVKAYISVIIEEEEE